jgi:kynurenine formamidase
MSSKDLHDVLELLRDCRWVDLTHAFDSSIPHCSSFDPERRLTLYHYDEGIGAKGSGFLAHQYTLPGQWGTHVDPPAHFVRGLRFQDDIPVTEMILPLVVLDIHEAALDDPDYCVSMGDVHRWESRNGPIPKDSFVALRSDWFKRWPDPIQMFNKDESGVAHFPGWSQEVLSYLAEDRNVTAIGHDTTDTDPGVVVSRREAPLETYWLGCDKWQIELLTNLDQLPQSGALVICSWPKPKKGSGFPARVFAIVPTA